MKTTDRFHTKKMLVLSMLILSTAVAAAVPNEDEDDSLVIADKAVKKEQDESRSPIGCKNLGYKFDLKTLYLKSDSVEAKQSLYFIYNLSNKDINLFQMRGEESARSMYLNHKIGTKQWAVLSTSHKHMRYLCAIAEDKTPYGKIVDCGSMIKVCQYNNVRYGLNNQGNYWLVNSNTRNGAVNAVVHYGIIPGI